MCDSSTTTFANPILLDPGLKNLNLTGCHPVWKKVSVLTEQEELISVNSLSSYAFGLTSAKNQVTAALNLNGDEPFEVQAYVLEANDPASVVGNNALPENLVYLTYHFNKLVLQKHLLLKNVHVDVVKALALKHSKFNSVTLTFLFKFATNQEAREALERLVAHAAMLFCHGRGATTKSYKGKKNNVKRNGDLIEFTVYINADPDFHITAYVKPGKRGNSYAQFDSQADADAVYAISETCVRVEVKVSQRWLEQHGLAQPLNWKGAPGKAGYRLVLEELRTRLRVDERLRRNEPQGRHMADLSPEALTVLQAHLQGQNVWQLPQMMPNRGLNTQKVHQEVLRKLHIDMEFPWDQQRGKADPKLGDWLCWGNQFQVPANIAHLCMVRSTLKAKLKVLKAEVDALMATVSAKQASARRVASSKPLVKPVKKNKLLTMAKRQWRDRILDEDSTETSDISDLMG